MIALPYARLHAGRMPTLRLDSTAHGRNRSNALGRHAASLVVVHRIHAILGASGTDSTGRARGVAGNQRRRTSLPCLLWLRKRERVKSFRLPATSAATGTPPPIQPSPHRSERCVADGCPPTTDSPRRKRMSHKTSVFMPFWASKRLFFRIFWTSLHEPAGMSAAGVNTEIHPSLTVAAPTNGAASSRDAAAKEEDRR